MWETVNFVYKIKCFPRNQSLNVYYFMFISTLERYNLPTALPALWYSLGCYLYEYNFRERDYPTCFVEEKEENEQDHRYSYENRRPQRYKTNGNISKPTRQRWLRMFPPWKHQNKQVIHSHQLWLRSTKDFKTRVSCGLALPVDYRSRVQTRDKHMIDIQEATCYHDM